MIKQKKLNCIWPEKFPEEILFTYIFENNISSLKVSPESIKRAQHRIHEKKGVLYDYLKDQCKADDAITLLLILMDKIKNAFGISLHFELVITE